MSTAQTIPDSVRLSKVRSTESKGLHLSSATNNIEPVIPDEVRNPRISSRSAHPPTPETFNQWASVYDTQLNPFLSLEQRILTNLLPPRRNQTILDAGCGTGRWLQQLATLHPKKLIGIDSSPAMLARAAQHTGATLHLAPCTSIPVDASTIDCVLSSFVLSYIEDLNAFAEELTRITRPNATILLSDLHPVTAQEQNWRRTFPTATGEIEIAAHPWHIEALIQTLAAKGLHLTARIEPTFAAPERTIFAQANKLSTYEALQQHPAICILAFTRSQPTQPTISLTSARTALSPQDTTQSNLNITTNKITSLTSATAETNLDLTNYLLLPGLINAHDHLEFALFPRLGHGPYANSKAWGEDIHARDAGVIALHRSIPREARIHWGALRNLLCGVTTVCHHNPLTPQMRAPDFPVTVLEDFAWTHSLALDPEATAKARAANPATPFLLHAAEGIDSLSAAELAHLENHHALNANTILIHGLALRAEDAHTLNQHQAALITCPSSNHFLFAQIPARDLLLNLKHLALGSDSPLTAIGDLLDELRFTRKHLALPDELLYQSITTHPASILRLKQNEGRIAPNSCADLIAIRDHSTSPAARLAQLTAHDVELVIRRGRIFLASEDLYTRLPLELRAGLEPLLLDGEPRWLRAPLAQLFAAAAPVMRNGILPLAGKELRHGHGHAA